MMLRVAIVSLLAWQGCYGCCWAEKPAVPKAVQRILALEATREMAPDVPALEKKISKKLVKLSEEDYQIYLGKLVLDDAAALARIVGLHAEWGAFRSFEPNLLQIFMSIRHPGGLVAQEAAFYAKQKKRKEQINQAQKTFLQRLSLPGYASYMTDICNTVVVNEVALRNEERADFRFPRGIISIILSYMPDRTSGVTRVVKRGSKVDTITVSQKTGYGQHVLADVGSRQEYSKGRGVRSITFMRQRELQLLASLYADPGSADADIAIPSNEQIKLMQDQAEDSLYDKIAITLPIAYRFVTLKDEQKGDEVSV